MTPTPRLGSIWRRGRKQVEVLGTVKVEGEAELRVQLAHWAADGLRTFPKLSTFLATYTEQA